jgi:transposase
LETSQAIWAAELERMMNLQDVILKAMAKKITWLEAAEIIGVCDRTMRRMRERYQEHGYDGLFDQRRRKRTTLRVPMETAERVLALYRDTYFDLSVRHFHEKLREEHAIELSYTWVKQALQGAGLVAGARSAARIGGAGLAGRCRACCCISTAASIAGFATIAITTCW